MAATTKRRDVNAESFNGLLDATSHYGIVFHRNHGGDDEGNAGMAYLIDGSTKRPSVRKREIKRH